MPGDETQSGAKKHERGGTRVATRGRGRAPVADQNVIAKIKESVSSDARDATRLDTRVLLRVLQWVTDSERKRRF